MIPNPAVAEAEADMSGCAFNVLEEPIVRVELTTGAQDAMTLPEVYGGLAADRIETFPALRAHQVPAWHAFLVQIAAMGLEALGCADRIGDDERDWAEALRALTPNWPSDEPWCLVAPPTQPALLQAPVPISDLVKYEKELKNHVTSPDTLDMLSTAKNHDLKADRMRHAAPDDWMFALVSLQTQEGVMGRGNYGIARMNSGYGNRSYVSFRPSEASAGASFRRDLDALFAAQNALWDEAGALGLAAEEATALLWTVPWSGRETMPISRLHPLFVEVCRRVRLEFHGGALFARLGNSDNSRVDAKHLKGNLADPWTPIELSDSPKALSVTQKGFTYQHMNELLFGSKQRSWRLPILARPRGRETELGSQFVAAGIARGQGKTEGFHQRIVDIPPKAAALLETGDHAVSKRAQERARQAADVQGKCLRPALIALVQKGPSEPTWDKPSNASLTQQWLIRFDKAVDRIFFTDLWDSLDMNDDEAASAWCRTLSHFSRDTLEAASEAAPRADERRVMARARASNLLEGSLHKHLPSLNQE